MGLGEKRSWVRVAGGVSCKLAEPPQWDPIACVQKRGRAWAGLPKGIVMMPT